MSTNKAFHIQSLADEYNRRSQANPHYSLRSFARDLDVAVSWLSDFLAEKKGLSAETAERLAATLGLSPTESKLFLLSTKAYHSRSTTERAEAMKELKALKKSDAYKMRPQDFASIGTWYHQAILELTELEEFNHHEFEIAERLRLPLQTIRRALQELQDAGVLEIKNGKMKAQFPETESSADLPSAAIRKYHEQILQKGLKALHEQPIDQREYTSVTFAFEADRVVEAKKALRKFHKQFTDEFYSNSKNKDSVYQLSFQFFRIDQKRK